MSLTHFLANRLGLSSQPASRNKIAAARPRFRPTLEALEDRCLPSTLTVTTTADSGPGSLRAEIKAAHEGDTIVFASKLDSQSITLTSGELLINKNLTIAGPGASQLTISGNNSSRVFESATGYQATLSDLKISNGFAVNGAGIEVDSGATLTVNNCTLSGNKIATSKKGSGNDVGGIDNFGTLTVSGCTLSGNSGTGAGGIENEREATLTVNNNSLLNQNTGGGIFNFGTASISGGSISNNSAGGITYGSGGGISNVGTLTVSGCTFSQNTAIDNGGGIYNDGTLTVNDCVLSNNTAGNGGGGIYSYGGTITISSSIVSYNTAEYGGGICFWAGDTVATISGSTVTGNTAEYGGGLYIGTSCTVTVENSSIIIGNLAPSSYTANDIYNLGVLYLDSNNTIGILDGNPAEPI